MTAATHFQITASRSDGEGLFSLASALSSQGFSASSAKGFGVIRDLTRNAAAAGHLPAKHALATIFSQQANHPQSCSQALELFAEVTQRLPEAQADFSAALRRALRRDVHHGLLIFMDLAFQGFSEAQSNAAFLLERRRSKILTFGQPRVWTSAAWADGFDLPAAPPFLKDIKNSDVSKNVTRVDSVARMFGMEKTFKTARKTTKKAEKSYTTDQKTPKITQKSFKTAQKTEKNMERFFTDPFVDSFYHFYALAADQGDVEAIRKLGDYHYAASRSWRSPTENKGAWPADLSMELIYTRHRGYLERAEQAQSRRGAGERAVSQVADDDERLRVVYEMYRHASEADAEATFNLGFLICYEKNQAKSKK